MNIFVGNLSFQANENDVRSIFEAFGTVTWVKIKKKSGENSRGFGFVAMPDELQAQAAITSLQDKDFMGRPLSVSIERPKAVKPKKDYKEIKRLRQQVSWGNPTEFKAPIISEKAVKTTVNLPERNHGKKERVGGPPSRGKRNPAELTRNSNTLDSIKPPSYFFIPAKRASIKINFSIFISLRYNYLQMCS